MLRTSGSVGKRKEFPLETVRWHPLIFRVWVRLGLGLGQGLVRG